MAQTVAHIETRLTEVRAAISAQLTGGVSEFEHEGGDRAKLISLTDLRLLEQELLRQLSAARRAGRRFSLARPVTGAILIACLLGLGGSGMAYDQVIAGAGIEPTVVEALPAAQAPASPRLRGQTVNATTTPYAGAEVNRLNYSFQPPHRSGDSAVRLSWDMLVRRCRWLADNTPMISRMVGLLVQQVIGEGLSVYSAAVDHVPLQELAPGSLLTHPLFLWGDEADAIWERWAEGYADVARQQSLYELQRLAVRDVFASGNALLLECRKRSPAGVANVCYQLIEAEQLDRLKDRPATAAQNLISNGIEYAADGEPVAYWLYDAHPYDDQVGFAQVAQSRRIPASRVTHLYLPTRASQHFGTPIGQIAMQTARDVDWLLGYELTAAALAAGLTLIVKESDTPVEIGFDGASETVTDQHGLSHLVDVGLAAGTVARVGRDENVEVVESNRPNPNMEPFVKLLQNQAAMSGGLSLHRYTGDPSGASFAVLRAMINDDRAMALPLVNAFGKRLARRPREVHDRLTVASGRYGTVTPAEYLRRVEVYTDYDVLGPPLRHLNPTEDVTAARMRIACGLSTLRIECGLLGLSYRAVLRQLAVERDLTRALELSLDFSNGGGQASARTTTDAGGTG